jgi:hypothetical protein
MIALNTRNDQHPPISQNRHDDVPQPRTEKVRLINRNNLRLPKSREKFNRISNRHRRNLLALLVCASLPSLAAAEPAPAPDAPSATTLDSISVIGRGEARQVQRVTAEDMKVLPPPSHLLGFMPSREEARRSVGPVARGTIMGFLVGLLPGGGAVLASFASYTLEKKIKLKAHRKKPCCVISMKKLAPGHW